MKPVVWWRSAYFLLALTSLFWSLNWVIGRGVVGQIPPITLAFGRWLVAVTLMLPFAWPQIREHWPLIREHRKIIVLLGITGMGFHNLLSYWGLNYTTATNGVILNSAIPIMIILIGAIFFGLRLSAVQFLGVLISLCGVMAILSQGQLSALLNFQFNIGDVIVLASMLLWSVYTLMLKWRPNGLPALAFLCLCGIVGVAGMTPLFLWEMTSSRSVNWSWSVAAVFLYVGLFPSFLGYIFWNKGVEKAGPTVAGLFVHLMPVFGSILAWLFLDESLGWFHLLGVLLILGGIALTSRRA